MKSLYFICHTHNHVSSDRLMVMGQDLSRAPISWSKAGVIATRLSEVERLDRIICSPSMAARQTAKPFSKLFGVDIEIDERINERSLGELSTMASHERTQDLGSRQDISNHCKWTPDEGESLMCVAERLESFFLQLGMHDAEHILVVTHSEAMRMIKALLEATVPVFSVQETYEGVLWKVQFSKLCEAHFIESLDLGDARTSFVRVS